MEEVARLTRSAAAPPGGGSGGAGLGRDLMQKSAELRRLHSNMSKWRAETTDKLANKFKDEMSRELEK